VLEYSVNGKIAKPLETQGLHKTPGCCGPVREAICAPFLAVYGTRGSPEANARNKKNAEQFAQEWFAFTRSHTAIKADKDVTEAEKQSKNLFLFGEEQENLLHAAAAAKGLPFVVKDGAVTIGQKKLALGQTGVGARVSTPLIPSTDLALSGYWSQSESWTAALNASVAPLYDIPGWDTLQLWFEGCIYDKARYLSVSSSPPTGLNYSFLVGGTATMPWIRTVLLTEYYHLSEGLDAGQTSAVYDGVRAGLLPQWYPELARRPASLGSDYLFVSVTQPTLTDDGNLVFDKIGLLASCLLNLADTSFFLTAGVTTTFVKESEVDLTVTWANGGADTEFGNTLTSVAATLDVKVFF